MLLKTEIRKGWMVGHHREEQLGGTIDEVVVVVVVAIINSSMLLQQIRSIWSLIRLLTFLVILRNIQWINSVINKAGLFHRHTTIHRIHILLPLLRQIADCARTAFEGNSVLIQHFHL